MCDQTLFGPKTVWATASAAAPKAEWKTLVVEDAFGTIPLIGLKNSTELNSV